MEGKRKREWIDGREEKEKVDRWMKKREKESEWIDG